MPKQNEKTFFHILLHYSSDNRSKYYQPEWSLPKNIFYDEISYLECPPLFAMER